MTNYRRGYNAELKAVHILEQAGYEAIRTARSGGKFDVVAVGAAGVRLIQVKRLQDTRGLNRIEEDALEELSFLSVPASVSREVWIWVDGQGFMRQKAL